MSRLGRIIDTDYDAIRVQRSTSGDFEPRTCSIPQDWAKPMSGFGVDRVSAVRPAELEGAEIEAAIQQSKTILSLRQDWDDDQSPFYAEETWKAAVSFLRRLALHCHSAGVAGIGVPEISPAEHGSIDLFWKTDDDSTMLVNVPADSNEPLSYYGKRKGKELWSTSKIDEDQPELIAWLTRLR